MEGVGSFTVGEDEQAAGPGVVVWAPVGLPHGVHNEGMERLVLLMGIAPPRPSN
jgi:mannose-6-phosphate isomerase-like protein (cupin superfamily)